MKLFQRVVCASVFLLPLALLSPTEAQAWARDGTPVATGPQSQIQSQVLGADDGGAFVVWTDQGTSGLPGYVVRVQKLGPGGTSEWAESGLQVGSPPGAQDLGKLASDGQGGIIVAWSQFSPNGSDAAVYAQRFTARGQRLWGDQGVRLAPLLAEGFALVGDGAGGAFAVGDTVVLDSPFPGYDPHLLVQHVGDRGQLLWPAGALPVIEVPSQQREPKAVSDGHGGVIVAWIDGRELLPNGFVDYNIYAQRFAGDGSRLWLSTGAPVCLNQAQQSLLNVTVRPSGGIDLAWEDTRKYPLFQDQTYAQSLDENGEPRWAQDGVLVSPYGEQGATALTDDGADGIIIAWWSSSPQFTIDIFAQHLDASGSPLWQVGGITLAQQSAAPTIVSDGEGGAVVLLTSLQAIVQHLSGAGALLQSELLSPTAVGYGSLTSAKNQFIVAWGDVRNGPDNIDVYATRFKLSPSHAPPSLSIRENETPQPSAGNVSLTVSPNPARGSFTVSAAGAGGSPARLSVFDMRGRLVVSRDVGMGAMSMTVGGREHLEPGIYLAVVEQGKTKAVQRICLLP